MYVRKFQCLILCSVIAIFTSNSICADDMEDDAGQLFQAGLFAEHGTGDLNKAIELYETAFEKEYEDDELAAKILLRLGICYAKVGRDEDAKRSEEHTSELQSHSFTSYAVFFFKKKKKTHFIS